MYSCHIIKLMMPLWNSFSKAYDVLPQKYFYLKELWQVNRSDWNLFIVLWEYTIERLEEKTRCPEMNSCHIIKLTMPLWNSFSKAFDVLPRNVLLLATFLVISQRKLKNK